MSVSAAQCRRRKVRLSVSAARGKCRQVPSVAKCCDHMPDNNEFCQHLLDFHTDDDTGALKKAFEVLGAAGLDLYLLSKRKE